MKNDRVREFVWLDTRSPEESSNYDRILYDKKNAEANNLETEKKVRLNRDVAGLEIKEYKNGNQEQINFIYDLKKQVYKEYVEKVYGEWNEKNQKKLFSKFMKDNHKGIGLIYLKEELVGFYNGNIVSDTIYEIGNICIKPEFQNKGIGTAILKKIIFENKNKEIKLQCFKNNPAIKLYERLGFKKVDESQTHYILRK